MFKTYRGTGVDDPSAMTRFGITLMGFHAIILAPSGTIYIDPYAKSDTEHYISYYKRDYAKEAEPFLCNLSDESSALRAQSSPVAPQFESFGFVRFYRLAMAATSGYTNFFRLPADTDAQARDRALAAIKVTVNRVNSIFERDLGVRLMLLTDSQERQIIYVPTDDPYVTAAGVPMVPGTQAINDKNQTNLDAQIGSDNYDIGHVVGVGTGGLAQRPAGSQNKRPFSRTLVRREVRD